MTGLVAALRSATKADHERLDGLFERFDLGDAQAYRRFLIAHARALPAAEAAIAVDPPLDGWQPRAALLAADLNELGVASPSPLTGFDLPDEAARWGAIYVLEGSRLGGALLSRRVAAGLPRRYLGAVHESGSWRNLLVTLDNLPYPANGGEDRVVTAARRTFALFEQAARLDEQDHAVDASQGRSDDM